MSAQLRLVEPRNENRSVRPANADLRQREYLTSKEVERVIKTTRDGRYGHGLHERAVATFVGFRKQSAYGYVASAFARPSSVPSDGEILPFSILESVPAEIPAAAPSSATVRSIDLRNRRTSNPILS